MRLLKKDYLRTMLPGSELYFLPEKGKLHLVSLLIQ